MPGMPKFSIIRPMIESEKIFIEDQKKDQLREDILLYLIKHSRLDIAKTIREV